MEIHDRDTPMTIEVSFTVSEHAPNRDSVMDVQNLWNVRILDDACPDTGRPLGEPGSYTARIRLPPLLNVGDYTIGMWMGTGGYEEVSWRNELLNFRLEGESRARAERILQLHLPWSLERSHEIASGAGH